ncbi:hypothetical protein V6N13_092063 [Hibiscus sabdariffa]
MVDDASGGALVNMTPNAARGLISTMATNFQQFSSEPSRRVHEISIVSLENKIDKLTNIVNSLVARKTETTRVCEICAMSGQEKFQNRTETHLQELDKHINQLAQPVGRIKSQGKLPSQAETKPKVNVSVITLRSGTTVRSEDPKENAQKEDEEIEPLPTKGISNLTPIPSSSEVPPYFPSRLVNRDKQDEDKGIL